MYCVSAVFEATSWRLLTSIQAGVFLEVFKPVVEKLKLKKRNLDSRARINYLPISTLPFIKDTWKDFQFKLNPGRILIRSVLRRKCSPWCDQLCDSSESSWSAGWSLWLSAELFQNIHESEEVRFSSLSRRCPLLFSLYVLPFSEIIRKQHACFLCEEERTWVQFNHPVFFAAFATHGTKLSGKPSHS